MLKNNKNNKNRRILAIISLLGLIFLQTIPLKTQAASVTSSLDWANSIDLDDEEDIEDLTNYVDKKDLGPVVELSFSSDDNFNPGSDVTVNAVTTNFQTGTDDLYFTWYLKKDGCDLTKNWYITSGNNQPEKSKSSCDLDGDELVTPNDWKIAATRAVIKREAGKASSSSSGINAVPSVENNNNGWIKNFERDGNNNLIEENDESAPDCYIQNSESGLSYELRKTEVSFESCPSGYKPACVKAGTASCDVLNTDPPYPTTDQDCPPWIEESDPAYDPDLCTDPVEKTISSSEDVCAVDKIGASGDVFKCDVNAEDLEHYKATLSCDDQNSIPICVQEGIATNVYDASVSDDGATDTKENLLGTIFPQLGTNSENESAGICSILFKANTNTDPKDPPPNFTSTSIWVDNKTNGKSCSYLTDALINGIKESVQVGAIAGVTTDGVTIPQMKTRVEGNSKLQPECSFTKGANLCKHLFPYFPKTSVTVNEKIVNLEDDKTGDGKFTENEKMFWKTSNTDSGGEITPRDETLITGKGLDEFTWLYAKGDEVGLVVEGESYIGSAHSDASYKRMWAFSNRTCDAMEEKDSDTEDAEDGENIRGFYTEDKINVLTADFDLDRCLEENLLDPTENEDGIGEMTVSLTATPAAPINATSGGDTLKVVTGSQNVDNLGSVSYKWTVERSKSGTSVLSDDTEWYEITDDLWESYGSLKESDLEGLGKNSLNILLNLPAEDDEEFFYLKIKVKTEEGDDSAWGSITVKVLQQKHQIAAYSVIAGEDLKLTLDSNEICTDAATEGVCQVTENKLIGLRISNSDDLEGAVSWMVNGVSMSCPTSASSECSDGNLLIFPALGNVDEVIVVTASGVTSAGTTSITRYFLITEPQIRIVTTNTDNVWPKLMGFFKDLDSNKTADYSDITMETNTGNTVTLQADTAASWGYFGQSFTWTVDGSVMDTTENSISFVADKETGDSYSVAVVLDENYTDENVKKINYLRKALANYWGVDSSDYNENAIGASVDIEVVDNTYQTALNSKKSGIFASLLTNLPQQFMFLIKIFSTSFLVLFAMILIFAVTPETLFEKEKKEETY